MRITTGHATRPRLPPRGVDQALDQMRPHVLELDPANSSLLPRDRHAYGLHPATAGQASQQWRHERLLIAPIIAPLRAPEGVPVRSAVIGGGQGATCVGATCCTLGAFMSSASRSMPE